MDRGPSIDSLEVIETCFARVHRSATEVFKIRRPVRLRLGDEWVDLSTPESRHAACREEERLGRALAPDVVLGVVPITAGSEGRRRIGGRGPAVEWALRMRRLAEAERADERLAAGTLDEEPLAAVARRLAAFHEKARGAAGPADERVLQALRRRIRMRIDAPDWPRRTPLPGEVERIEGWQLDFLETEAERFAKRAATDAIREGHGELGLEHVFVDASGEVRILAGLEVGPRLRRADVVADVAGLASELAARHRVDLAERFVADYARIANDFELYPLLDFYSSLRAAIRGKLDWLCADGVEAEPARADTRRERARRRFALALAAPRRPLLPAAVVAMGGQVASGKSTLAGFIARRIGAPVVGSDPTREFLLGAGVDGPRHEVDWETAYAPGLGDRVYDEVMRRAGEVLASGRPVVIDGCFRSRAQRERARRLAERFGRPFLFVEARVSRALQRERLAERARRDGVVVADWLEIADQLRAQWEPAEELEPRERLELDTQRPLEESASAIEGRLPTWPDGLTG